MVTEIMKPEGTWLIIYLCKEKDLHAIFLVLKAVHNVEIKYYFRNRKQHIWRKKA